jgi:hypothetical protein
MLFAAAQTDAAAVVDAELPSTDEYARGRGEYVRAGKGTPPPGATPVEGG